MTEMLCPFCDAPYTKEMLDVYNDTYGCDTGCDYLRYVVTCASCSRVLYVKGEFGSYVDEEHKKEYLDEVEDAELIEAIEKRIEE